MKASPWLLPARPAVGIAPTLSDAELLTLAVMSALLGYTSERRWLRRAGQVALTATIWRNARTGQPIKRSLTAYGH